MCVCLESTAFHCTVSSAETKTPRTPQIVLAALGLKRQRQLDSRLEHHLISITFSQLWTQFVLNVNIQGVSLI